MTDKFPENTRTFETRLEFLRVMYTDLFPQCDIMAHCIVHKLDWSYLAYIRELEKSAYYLTGEDPLKVLKRLN